MLRENAFKVVDKIRPSHVLVSVFDKDKLDLLVNALLGINPDVVFYSTGGTGREIKKILGVNAEKNYMSVEEYTGAPEMEGGLVKTLHPKIHAGLLGERGNPAHVEYLEKILTGFGRGSGVYFDLLVSNFYPFDQVIQRKDTTAEIARINIDIGGPTMIRAAAKNWQSTAVLSGTLQYKMFIDEIKANGFITAQTRFALARVAFGMITTYDAKISEYFMGLNYFTDVLPTIELE